MRSTTGVCLVFLAVGVDFGRFNELSYNGGLDSVLTSKLDRGRVASGRSGDHTLVDLVDGFVLLNRYRGDQLG